MEIHCQTCFAAQRTNELLTGFPGPNIIEEVRKAIKESVAGVESIVQNAVMVLMRGMAGEARRGPRLISLLPYDMRTFDPRRIGQERYQLNLWCEMPGEQHPTCKIGSGGPGEYTFMRPKAWLVKAAPYVSFAGKIIKGLIPLAQAAGAVAAGGDMLGRIDLMTGAVDSLLEGDLEIGVESPELKDALGSSQEGAALRALHALLEELDPQKSWGGLRGAATPTGDYLWLCGDHYKVYEPGLPKL